MNIFKQLKVIGTRHPWKQYDLLLLHKSSFPHLILYWILKHNIFPIFASFMFYLYYPPQYNQGPDQTIFLNFMWWLSIYGVLFVTVLVINFLWYASIGFNFKLSCNLLEPINKDINVSVYVFILYELIMTCLGFLLVGWFETIGTPMRPNDFIYKFWVILAGYLLSDQILNFVQLIFQRTFLDKE